MSYYNITNKTWVSLEQQVWIQAMNEIEFEVNYQIGVTIKNKILNLLKGQSK